MEGREVTYVPPSVHLPPQDIWLHNPYLEDSIPTPVDERGLVDSAALITLMKSTVEPGYDWYSRFADEHHLQWPDRWYPRMAKDEYTPHVFRNLAISKMIVPRVFHNWVHRITEPPPPPSDEVMRYRIDAQRVAIALFREVRNSKTMARKMKLGDGGLESLLVERFDNFASTFEEAKQTPREFQLLNYENYTLQSPEDMLRIGTKLGRFAVTASATDRVKRLAAA